MTVVGTPGSAGAYTQIVLAENAPPLETYCTNHTGMGNDLITNAGSHVALGQHSDLAFDEWIPLENNVYVGRTFQFKAVLTTDNVDQTPLVDQLGVIVQFERRTENSGTIASGTSGKAVLFENAFYTDADTEVTVGITAFEFESGDYYRITNLTGAGFTITFYNSSNVVINRNFQYTAIGYGTKQP